MSNFDKLIKNINEFIAKSENEEDSIIHDVEEFPGIENLPQLAEDFEAGIAKLLRRQKKFYVDAFNEFISKDDLNTLGAFLNFMQQDLFAEDDFVEEFGKEAAKFLNLTTEELTKLMMESIDRDVSFNVLSKRTTDWIQNWSSELAKIMQLSTHKALEKELIQAIEAGESIAQAELRIKELPQFDRKRARTTAQTEILTASSQAHYESFMQSPAVVGKTWKHSGTKKNNPRPTHVAMDGVTIPVDDYFEVDGERGLFPRDPNFSAKNRVHCGCVIGPSVDKNILGLSAEEKEQIRQEVLAEMNS
ncbi:phage minor head protein [Ornithinibacillus sp. 4-3]|uniref:Phage minor head protein n=1 Tax=Ornithinibacillus sp. 4-3 TaxID=3231488 RepID=A0AB39HS84_9BACI